MVDVAEVHIWGQLAGAVWWDKNRHFASFQYDKNFVEKGIDLSPIKMPIKNRTRIYQFKELRKDPLSASSTFKGLPGLVADSLPDRYGNQLIDMWLAKNGRAPGSMNPVEQLCFIGSRGLGALEFYPAKFKNEPPQYELEVDTLVETSKKMLQAKEAVKVNLNERERHAMGEILKIGTSAGGARPKAIIAYNEKTGEVRTGQSTVPLNFEHWILKLDGVSDAQFGTSQGYGRVEYAYYLMAKACGIEMMESKLLEENGRAHFMTKRFDRLKYDEKVHVQTFCGLQHFDYENLNGHSYEQLFQTMRMLRLSYQEAEQMFRRMVFNVLATNFDDHTKNFSFILPQNGKWKLAPAYDVCYSYDPNNIWVSQNSLSINGKHKNINIKDFLKIAKENSVKKAEKIVESTLRTIQDWPRFATEAGVHEERISRIHENLMIHKFQ